MTTTTGTVRLHRVLRAPAERVYKAFMDAKALEYWLPPYGFTGTVHEIAAREGGGYRMSFTLPGWSNPRYPITVDPGGPLAAGWES